MVCFKVYYKLGGKHLEKRVILDREEARRYGEGLARAFFADGKHGTAIVECTTDKGKHETLELGERTAWEWVPQMVGESAWTL